MEELITQIHTLYEQYKDDNYMLKRLSHNVMYTLPLTLRTENLAAKDRAARLDRLVHDRKQFITRFLATHMYYYCSRSEQFIKYDGENYNVYSADNIIHDILTEIPVDGGLYPWKHRVKGQLMKKIKERSPLGSIPESVTIQSTIDAICPRYFSTRNAAKYFLTVLGDCILGKKVEYNYIGSPVLRPLMKGIEDCMYLQFGNVSTLTPIKLKYYDHAYSTCKLLMTNLSNQPNQTPIQSRHMLNLLCVAAHYSMRYENAELFLDKCHDSTFVNKVLFICDKTTHSIAKEFADSALNHCIGATMTEANILFVWKKYLENNELPDIVFKGSLINELKEQINYDTNGKHFVNITSIHMPVVSSFTNFWAETMQSIHNIDGNNCGYEIDEVISLFKKWNKKKIATLPPELALELIQEFFPDNLIKEERTVIGVVSTLWNKKECIDTFFSTMCKRDAEQRPVNIASAYHIYSIELRPEFIMSKECFTTLTTDKLIEYIDNNGIIDETYWPT